MKNVRFLCLTSCLLLPLLQSNIAIAAPKAKTGTPATVASDNEIKLWAEVEKDGSAEAYQVYLDEYPNGKYATLAKRRIKPQAPAAAQRQGQAPTANKTNAPVSKRPLRPALPLAISEAIWQALETSNNYRY